MQKGIYKVHHLKDVLLSIYEFCNKVDLVNCLNVNSLFRSKSILRFNKNTLEVNPIKSLIPFVQVK